ncbi:IspD/TarI family cytidylyltransferase [Spiroplasma diminutum]|uniref:2-C-methyl-D-erythritol 4-phosphate cytidylyltransferase n=1 Tax=Spiroplasma diminutum CUAS-1 TaxID=1276221 RepID=S5LVB2_9MOLU|nr:IspD/TarI family cytidylyltransferase [Spiroplasma diminutum]AGR41724.1 2-C-methyl-D-erythritol 4-phosphate cytidylyltransferase [Spiroplasma diminutum CUAS-1]
MISLIIVANGTGQRFGSNKMLLNIDGQYLINKTIKCFEGIDDIKEIIVVSNQEIFNIIDNKKVICVNGGNTRSQSVECGLKLAKQEYVLIHDGARPFITKKLIKNIVNSLKNNEVVVPFLKISNCLKRISNSKVKTVNREEYIQTQTPQGFKTSIIRKAYENNKAEFYDDCQLLEDTKYEIHFINGEEENKKITFITDI